MINSEKRKGMKTANQLLDKKYGVEGTESRKEFNKRAQEFLKMVENQQNQVIL